MATLFPGALFETAVKIFTENINLNPVPYVAFFDVQQNQRHLWAYI